jgi:hypothetical protein
MSAELITCANYYLVGVVKFASPEFPNLCREFDFTIVDSHSTEDILYDFFLVKNAIDSDEDVSAMPCFSCNLYYYTIDSQHMLDTTLDKMKRKDLRFSVPRPEYSD